MPLDNPRTFADHGALSGDTLSGEPIRRSAQETLDRLSVAGIDLEDVYRTLEDEGVEKLTQSWLDLLDTWRTGWRRRRATSRASCRFPEKPQATPRHRDGETMIVKTLTRQTENFEAPWEEAYGYVQAIQHGDTIYLSGQPARTTAPIS